MLLFTTAAKKHKLQFKKLSEYEQDHQEQCLELAEAWAKQAWGYVHEEEDFHRNDLLDKMEQLYIATFYNLPVGMFGLFEKRFTPSLDGDVDNNLSGDEVVFEEQGDARLDGAVIALGELDENKLDEHESTFAYLDYVYVDEKCRGFGFARQMINHAKLLAEDMQAELIYLETLNPKLDKVYLHHGAKQICESQYHSHPTHVLSFKL